MSETIKTSGLLEHLAALSGCQYLSDLTQPGMRGALRQAVEQTPAGEFSAQEWKGAVRYLTGQNSAGSAFNLRMLLILELSRP